MDQVPIDRRWHPFRYLLRIDLHRGRIINNHIQQSAAQNHVLKKTQNLAGEQTQLWVHNLFPTLLNLKRELSFLAHFPSSKVSKSEVPKYNVFHQYYEKQELCLRLNNTPDVK